MNLIHASSFVRRRSHCLELTLVREPDGDPCPLCRGGTATVWTATGAVVVTVPTGRLPRLVEALPHRCGEGGGG